MAQGVVGDGGGATAGLGDLERLRSGGNRPEAEPHQRLLCSARLRAIPVQFKSLLASGIAMLKAVAP